MRGEAGREGMEWLLLGKVGKEWPIQNPADDDLNCVPLL